MSAFTESRTALLLAVLLALGLMMAACGPAEDVEPDEPEEPEEPEDPDDPEEEPDPEEPAEPLEVVFAQGSDAGTLLAMEYIDMTTHSVIQNIHDPLITRDPETMEYAPALATDWEVIDDTTWKFNLQDDVYFHNGEHLTAEHIEFTMEYILDPDNEMDYRGRYERVEEVEVIDDYTLKIHTDGPMPILEYRLTSFYPLEKGYLNEVGHDEAAVNPVGTGPMEFVQWDHEERIVLEKNEDYWQGEVQVDELIFRPVPEFSTRVAGLLTGEIDIIRDVPGHMVDEVNASDLAEVRGIPSSRINYIALVNLQEGPMQNKKVRQAMNYAVDVDELIEHVLDGHANQMAGALSELNVHHNPDLEPYPYDPDRAVELIEEAGYDPEELELVLDSPTGRYPMDEEVALAISDQLGEIGIDVEVRINEWGHHLDIIMERETGDMFLLGWGPALEAQGTIESLMTTDRTYSGFSDPELDEMVEEAINVVEPEEQLEIWHEIEEHVHEEAPWIFLWQQYDMYGVSQDLDWTPRADEVTNVWDMGPK